MFQYNTLIFVVIMSLLISACGDSNIRTTDTAQVSISTSTEPLKYVVHVSTDDFVHPTERAFRANAYITEFENPIDRREFITAITQFIPLTADICERDEGAELEFEPEPIDIAVGDSIILTSSGSTYATLPLLYEGDRPYYEYGLIQSTEHSPNGLTVDFPDGIPVNLITQRLADITPITMISPQAGIASNVLTEFEWEPGNANYLRLSFSSGVHYIDCFIVDDGSYTFPESIVAKFENPLQSGLFTITRVNISMADSGDTLFFSSRVSKVGDYEFFRIL